MKHLKIVCLLFLISIIQVSYSFGQHSRDISLQIGTENLLNQDMMKTKVWSEYTDSSLLVGSYLNGLKTGVWFLCNNKSELRKIYIYRKGKVLVEFDLEPKVRNPIIQCDTGFVRDNIYFSIASFSDTRQLHSLKSLSNSLFFKKMLDISSIRLELSVESGISMKWEQGNYTRKYICFRIPMTNDNVRYVSFSRENDSLVPWKIHEIYSTQKDLLNGVHTIFNLNSSKPEAILNYNRGYFDGKNLLFDNQMQPKLIATFDLGKIKDLSQVKKSESFHHYFYLSKKYAYPKNKIFHPWKKDGEIETLYSPTQSIYSGFRGTKGNELDFEKLLK